MAKDAKDANDPFSSITGLPDHLGITEDLTRAEQRLSLRVERRRYGKPVTIVDGIDTAAISAKELASTLKRRLATGGYRSEEPHRTPGRPPSSTPRRPPRRRVRRRGLTGTANSPERAGSVGERPSRSGPRTGRWGIHHPEPLRNPNPSLGLDRFPTSSRSLASFRNPAVAPAHNWPLTREVVSLRRRVLVVFLSNIVLSIIET